MLVCFYGCTCEDGEGLVVDECGVCGGNGPEDFYDCDGNFIGTNVQIIHNSASPTVDVYVDGGLAAEGFEYRTATGVLSLPTSFTVGISTCWCRCNS